MCFSDLSSCNLIGLASSLAITIGDGLTASEASILSAFLTSLADNLAIIAAKKSIEESNDTSSMNKSECNNINYI